MVLGASRSPVSGPSSQASWVHMQCGRGPSRERYGQAIIRMLGSHIRRLGRCTQRERTSIIGALATSSPMPVRPSAQEPVIPPVAMPSTLGGSLAAWAPQIRPEPITTRGKCRYRALSYGLSLRWPWPKNPPAGRAWACVRFPDSLAAAQTARTSASRLTACSSSQQTAASHAARACAAMSCAPSSRPAAL